VENVRKFIINIVAESRSVYNSQSDANTVLVEFCECQLRSKSNMKKFSLTDVDWFDSNTLLNMGSFRRVGNLVGQNLRFA